MTNVEGAHNFLSENEQFVLMIFFKAIEEVILLEVHVCIRKISVQFPTDDSILSHSLDITAETDLYFLSEVF